MGRVHAVETPSADDDPRETFVIGESRDFAPSRSGWLYVFANDRADWYFDNKGEVALSLERL